MPEFSGVLGTIVSKISKILNRVLRGNADANIRFDDLCHLLAHLGFSGHIRGDHHIFVRDSVVEIINLQPRNGQAKAYQVKQVREIILTCGLAGESESDTPVEWDSTGEDTGRAIPEGDHDPE